MSNESELIKYDLYDDRVKNVVEEFYKDLLCLEDKVSQLFFLMIEASYDSSLLEEMELLLNIWKCGGIIFLGGSISRQHFLIQTFKSVSKNHLLIGNDLQHGLALLVEKSHISLNDKNLDWFLIGQELSSNNLFHGILIQLNFNLGLDIEFFNSDIDRNLFFSGIKKNKQSVIASCVCKLREKPQVCQQAFFQTCSLEKLKQDLYHCQQKKISNYKEFSFVNLSLIDQELTIPFFIQCFKSGIEGFLFSTKSEIDMSVKLICELIRSGKLSALLFDKILEKILLLKAISQEISSHSFV